MVARGEYLTRAADCVACHGKPFAGGMAYPLPFGSLYSSNITPDKNTGIGAWSDEDFVKALQGRRQGRQASLSGFVEIIFSHVRRVLFCGHETISDDALLTGWEFHQ
jgi:hypothetical protein